MALEHISQSAIIPLPRPIVWQKMLDPDVLARCIDGCQQLVLDTDHRYRAIVKYKVGPMSRLFKGTVMLTHIVPQASLRFRRGSYRPFEGNGAFSGTVQLGDHEHGVEILVRAQIEAPAMVLKVLKLVSPMGSEDRLREFVTKFVSQATSSSV